MLVGAIIYIFAYMYAWLIVYINFCSNVQKSNPEYCEDEYLFLEGQLDLYIHLCYVSILLETCTFH